MPNITPDRQATVIGALVEGSSIASTARMTGVHRNTIGPLILRFGRACERLMADQIRGVECSELQLDEVWGFVGKKRRQVRDDDDPAKVGDFWTWVALDPESKLVPGYHVGKRTMWDAHDFVRTLRSRVEGRPQLSTDKLGAYRSAILGEWSEKDGQAWSRPDWGTIVKRFQVEPANAGRYSPPHVVGVRREVASGNPDVDRICTSHVERSHLTLRMSMRRMTRLTNGFSKTVQHLRAAVALHFAYYNFCRVHRSIKTTPALASGAADRVWTVPDLVEWAGCFR